jgi:hypothetical protein
MPNNIYMWLKRMISSQALPFFYLVLAKPQITTYINEQCAICRVFDKVLFEPLD